MSVLSLTRLAQVEINFSDSVLNSIMPLPPGKEFASGIAGKKEDPIPGPELPLLGTPVIAPPLIFMGPGQVFPHCRKTVYFVLHIMHVFNH